MSVFRKKRLRDFKKRIKDIKTWNIKETTYLANSVSGRRGGVFLGLCERRSFISSVSVLES